MDETPTPRLPTEYTESQKLRGRLLADLDRAMSIRSITQQRLQDQQNNSSASQQYASKVKMEHDMAERLCESLFLDLEPLTGRVEKRAFGPKDGYATVLRYIDPPSEDDYKQTPPFAAVVM